MTATYLYYSYIIEDLNLQTFFHTLDEPLIFQWTPKTIELQLIGLRQFHLAGWQENYACNIFDVYLAFHDDLLPGET